MRAGSLLGTLLLVAIGGFAAVYVASEADEPPPFVAKTRAAFGKAGIVTLEKAADYWLASADKKQPGDNVLGSGAALALAIRLGRIEAMRSGTQPVPDRLKRRFRKHYPDDVLDEARWTVAEPGSRLARVLARWPVREGAVTLGNVIVFKTEGASKNHGLFAHELVHVGQYEKLGINEFARRYAENPAPIEEEARAKARRVVRSL
ncbi:MAG: DUF4157 domain-containing protein [Pseudomonadota bacterium]|nr:DUF4157 domain-containing protein [Pseudomonadota bacterium]